VLVLAAINALGVALFAGAYGAAALRWLSQGAFLASLVVAFGIFEWMVRTGRMRSRRAALIFPLLCALGGGLLLTHSHAAQNLKDEFLLEVTHTPLGVLAMMIGWTRWLELRLPEGRQRLPRGIWAIGLALIGVLLIFYRES